MPSQCVCVRTHRPRPFAFQVHHVRPRGWGGLDIDSNKAIVCGSAHDNIHHALDEAVRVAYGKSGAGMLSPSQIDVIVKPYTAYTQMLIRRAISEATAGGALLPRVYTLSSGGTHDEPHCSE